MILFIFVLVLLDKLKKKEKSLMRNLDLSLKPGSAQVLPIQVGCRGSY